MNGQPFVVENKDSAQGRHRHRFRGQGAGRRLHAAARGPSHAVGSPACKGDVEPRARLQDDRRLRHRAQRDRGASQRAGQHHGAAGGAGEGDPPLTYATAGLGTPTTCRANCLLAQGAHINDPRALQRGQTDALNDLLGGRVTMILSDRGAGDAACQERQAARARRSFPHDQRASAAGSADGGRVGKPVTTKSAWFGLVAPPTRRRRCTAEAGGGRGAGGGAAGRAGKFASWAWSWHCRRPRSSTPSLARELREIRPGHQAGRHREPDDMAALRTDLRHLGVVTPSSVSRAGPTWWWPSAEQGFPCWGSDATRPGEIRTIVGRWSAAGRATYNIDLMLPARLPQQADRAA